VADAVNIEGAEVEGWKLIKPKYDGTGREVEPAKLGLQMTVPLSKASRYLQMVARMFRNKDEVTLTLASTVEQLELGDREGGE
jgi:hypothetical protein